MAVFFIATARFQVKFPRYLLPLYPLIFIFAASIIAPRGKRVRVADGPGDEEPQEAPVQMVASASVAPEAVATEPLQQEVVSVETTPAETAHGEPAERTNS
jgi:hypothetical protein